MRYYKEYDENGQIAAVGAGDALNGIDITEEEYSALLAEMEAKAEYAEQLYRGEITIDDVPEEYREEVQARVDEMTAELGEGWISDSEAIAIITGGEAE